MNHSKTHASKIGSFLMAKTPEKSIVPDSYNPAFCGISSNVVIRSGSLDSEKALKKVERENSLIIRALGKRPRSFRQPSLKELYEAPLFPSARSCDWLISKLIGEVYRG